MTDLTGIELERALCRAFLKWTESEVVIYRSIQLEQKCREAPPIQRVYVPSKAQIRREQFEEKDRKNASRRRSRN